MTSSRLPSTRSQDNLDISIARSLPWRNPKVNWPVYIAVTTLAMVFYFLDGLAWLDAWMLLAVPGLLILAMLVWCSWVVIVRRGVFTWMRLARQPAAAWAQGNPDAAQRALQTALAQARRFAPQDHRRGLMLVELAGYVKNQGRTQEAGELYEECVEVLALEKKAQPMDYFVSLNNYAIHFIHLRDYEAAQRILEKILDLTPEARKGVPGGVAVFAHQVLELEFVLYLNLAVLFIMMNELSEAQHYLQEAAGLFQGLKTRRQAALHDHFAALRAHWHYAAGQFAAAWREIDTARDPNYASCLRVRAKLQLVTQDFAAAEQLLRNYFDQERKKGSLHRPELLDQTLELAECLFGQGNHEGAFAALREARTLVADFALPLDRAWHKTLQSWLQRTKEFGWAELIGSLETDLRKMPGSSNQAIAILDRFRIQPQTSGKA